ncbi:hypothetical protein BTR22_17040 [Alkalihalophilus pseudofirmus]|jgi:hypothetical protein|uniref:Fur-regulated basic protein FbpA n=2 Tax=Alkalihalophilus TaxID=2893060 RepID=A0AAJ2NR78_ALKPS|nr:MULTISPECIES: Fur-regulated basic protein FbpA [Alkalihalophilus]ERN51708.1 hypothetical protein A33I_00940 [Alkalihalophilus marmarensis DSM 21297]MCM3491324.1 Fur-regulated basic protein FbpA [Alkalihalophilus marmarensis]MDV2887140.1 Fur-regulated basic protein FbpA [Alkalihalophilus pseudofirmus]OLS34893.1 hypothetical protein BTR22_17040 [Alkalihalophilus pseudofirmus]WEG17223.1 Fur-regulated basic protein FbpA [Alkalihalophilus pseudofirmus]
MRRAASETEQRKDNLIEKIIAFGVYKVQGRQLFELTLQEIERVYQSLKQRQNQHI